MSERGPAQRIVAAAGGGGNGGGAATADLSVAETVRLLEAGTGPLSTQSMVRVDAKIFSHEPNRGFAQCCEGCAV
jgi:hypothetical protein